MENDDSPATGRESTAAIKKQAVTSTFWSAMDNWGRQGIGFVAMVILARLLDPEDFGIVAMATLVIAILTMAVQDTFAEQLIRRHDLRPGEHDTCFWLIMAISALLSLVTALSADMIATLFDEPRVASVLRWLTPVIFAGGLCAVPNALLKREMRFKALAIRTSISLIIGVIVGVSLAFAGLGLWSLVIQQLVQAFAPLFVVWPACRWRPHASFPTRYLSDVFGYGMRVLGLRLVGQGDEMLPRAFVGYILGPAALGLYQLANKLFVFLKQVLVWPVGMVTLPTVAKVQNDPRTIQKITVRVTAYAAMFTFPCVVGVSLTAPEFIPILFGDKWNGAIDTTQILVLAGLFSAVNNINMQVMRALNRIGRQIILGAFRLALTAILMMVVTRWGPAWVAAAVLTSSLVMWPLFAWLFSRSTGVSSIRQHLAILPIAVATFGMALAVYGWKVQMGHHFSPLLLLVTESTVGAATYLLLLLTLARPVVTSMIQTILSARR